MEAAFSDVTLVLEDKHPLAAHKVILSATSPFLRHFLKEDADNHPLIYVGGLGPYFFIGNLEATQAINLYSTFPSLWLASLTPALSVEKPTTPVVPLQAMCEYI